MTKYLIAGMLLLGILTVGCTKEDEAASTVTQPEASPAATQQAATTAAAPSYSKQIGKLLLTVNGVADYEDDIFPAEPGTHYVAVDVTAKNTGSDTYSINVNLFNLQDSAKFANDNALTRGPEPKLGHHDMVPGQEIRSYIVFKVGDGRTPVQLQYRSFTGTPGTIDLAGLYKAGT